jgi:hypothetical protein
MGRCPVTIGKSFLRFWGLAALGCAFTTAAIAQDPGPGQKNYDATQVSFFLINPPSPVPLANIGVQRLDNPGVCPYYYWVVAKFLVGNATPAGPAGITNGACTLSSGNRVSWSSVDQATGYDLLRTSTPAPPVGACGCAVATGLTTTTAVDTGTLGAYTVNTLDPATLTCVVQNVPTGPGTSALTLKCDGLPPTPIGGGTCTPPGGAGNLLYDNAGACADASIVYTPLLDLYSATNNIGNEDFNLKVAVPQDGLHGAPKFIMTDGSQSIGPPFFGVNAVDFDFTPSAQNVNAGGYYFYRVGRGGANDRVIYGQGMPLPGGDGSTNFETPYSEFNAQTPGDGNAYNELRAMRVDGFLNGSDTVTQFGPLFQVIPNCSTNVLGTCIGAEFSDASGATGQGVAVLIDAQGGGSLPLEVEGGQSDLAAIGATIRSVSTDVTTKPGDFTVRCDATAGNRIITLPSSPVCTNVLDTDGSTVIGHSCPVYNIKKIDASANTCTIAGNGHNIDGAATLVISSQFANKALQFDITSATWNVLASASASGLSGTLATGTVPVATGPSTLGNSSGTDDGVNPTRWPNGVDTATNGDYEEYTVDTGGVTAGQALCVTSNVDGSGRPKVAPCSHTATQPGAGFVGIAKATAAAGVVAEVCWTVNCSAIFDNASTARNEATLSPTVDGQFHDTGSQTATAGQPNFAVLNANAGGGTASLVSLTGLLAQNPVGGGGGGKNTAIEINGTATKNVANFNGTTPAADANFLLCTWKSSNSGNTTSVSLECPQATTGQAGFVQLAADLGGTSTSPTIDANYKKRSWCIPIGSDDGPALTNANLGPQTSQYTVGEAVTVSEIDLQVNNASSTTNIQVRKRHCSTFTAGTCTAFTLTNFLSSALAAASTANATACANTGGTTGIDGGTTCSATLTTTAIAAGDQLELANGTADGNTTHADVCFQVNVNQ